MSKFTRNWPTEVILKKIQLFIDKYAGIDSRGNIRYSFFDFKTRKATKKILRRSESIRIFNELYGN